MEDPLMFPSVGITEPNFSRDPLGTEGEMSIGPDDINPYRSPEEREMVEQIKRKEREFAKRDNKTLQFTENPVLGTMGNPLDGSDPYVFDDVSGEIEKVELPFADSTAPRFPDF